MIFRSIDGNEDWAFGQGKACYATKQAAIALNVRTRLLIFLGEVFWALDAGVDWWNLIGGKNPAAQAGIILQCRTVIVQSYGIVRITATVPVFAPTTRALTVNYAADTIYTTNLVGSVTPVT